MKPVARKLWLVRLSYTMRSGAKVVTTRIVRAETAAVALAKGRRSAKSAASIEYEAAEFMGMTGEEAGGDGCRLP